MELKNLVAELNKYLKVEEIEDKSQNGLQVEGKHQVKKVSFAVDACQDSFKKAVESNSNLLIVHHGLFWSEPKLLVGNHLKRIKFLIENELSLYACHLPLDLHPEIGNNIQIIKILGLTPENKFGNYHGTLIGYTGYYEDEMNLDDFIHKVQEKFNTKPVFFKFGGNMVKKVAVISGGGADLITQIEDTEVDTFFTGEPKHEIYRYTKEIKKNIIFAGHYATETLGVKALQKYIKDRFNLDTHFIDLPTGV